MHKARAFFYVCAGIFLLALSYHLGATTALGQSSTIDGAVLNSGIFTGAVGRTFYWRNRCNDELHEVPAIPGTSKIVATASAGSNCGGGYYQAVLENGDCYGSDGSSWLYVGNVLGGLTPAQRETWGAMKSRYRGERGTAQPARQDR